MLGEAARADSEMGGRAGVDRVARNAELLPVGAARREEKLHRPDAPSGEAEVAGQSRMRPWGLKEPIRSTDFIQSYSQGILQCTWTFQKECHTSHFSPLSPEGEFSGGKAPDSM